MKNKIQAAFESIHATDELKQSMTAFVRQETAQQKPRAFFPMRYAFAMCAAVFVFVCGIGGYRLYQTPVSYISVDVNPSIELGLNRFDRVVSVDAYNDDGEAVLQKLDLKNKPYTEAVELLLSEETFDGYLSEDSLLSFTVVSDRDEALLAGIQSCRGYAENSAQCHSANAALRAAAQGSGLSFGKYQAFLELSQYDKSVTPEDCRGLSMRQLRDLISAHENGNHELPVPKDGNKGKGDGNGNGNGNHGGNGNGNDNGNHGGNGNGNSNGNHGGGAGDGSEHGNGNHGDRKKPGNLAS